VLPQDKAALLGTGIYDEADRIIRRMDASIAVLLQAAELHAKR